MKGMVFGSCNFWALKNFEQNSFSSSQSIKSQKMDRIMIKDACEICIKIEAKNMSKFQKSDLIQKLIMFYPGPGEKAPVQERS